MDNLKYEIDHANATRALAKVLNISPSQIDLVPLTEEEGSAIKVVVSTDLPTANKIARKLKKLAGDSEEAQE